ncbi:hypothetical protein AB6A40_001449 [Gnathostoma spinigerum]|uniref:Uncharacterized protein n=1 Tax=Gnathostoma spinigerum TaxID=75299 RepID=A0ABD6E575_9BILA
MLPYIDFILFLAVFVNIEAEEESAVVSSRVVRSYPCCQAACSCTVSYGKAKCHCGFPRFKRSLCIQCSAQLTGCQPNCQRSCYQTCGSYGGGFCSPSCGSSCAYSCSTLPQQPGYEVSSYAPSQQVVPPVQQPSQSMPSMAPSKSSLSSQPSPPSQPIQPMEPSLQPIQSASSSQMSTEGMSVSSSGTNGACAACQTTCLSQSLQQTDCDQLCADVCGLPSVPSTSGSSPSEGQPSSAPVAPQNGKSSSGSQVQTSSKSQTSNQYQPISSGPGSPIGASPPFSQSIQQSPCSYGQSANCVGGCPYGFQICISFGGFGGSGCCRR